MNRLEGKIALITGGTSGMGEAFAKLFAKEKAEVIVVGRNRERGNKVVKEILENGGKACFMECDVTSIDSIRNLRKEVDVKYGKLDILVNNAGILITDEFENTKEKDLEEITDASYPQSMEATPLSSADADFIKKLDQIINENLSSEKLSIKYLTDTMAMSRASLYNKVKQITGLGVNEYINRLRIERSVYLLANTNLSISEISYEVGFSYPRYFSTSFKQMKGVTPSQFKEKNKNSGHI